MMPTVATPRIQTPTSTATTIRTTLRALLPPVGAVAGTGAVEVTPGADSPGATAAPHLLQNFVPGFRVAPQELQNAIVTSGRWCEKSSARVYRRSRGKFSTVVLGQFESHYHEGHEVTRRKQLQINPFLELRKSRAAPGGQPTAVPTWINSRCACRSRPWRGLEE